MYISTVTSTHVHFYGDVYTCSFYGAVYTCTFYDGLNMHISPVMSTDEYFTRTSTRVHYVLTSTHECSSVMYILR